MKNKKILVIFLFPLLLSSCGKTLKVAAGTNMLWADEVGFLSRAASVIEEGNTRYIVYETNKKKNNENISFAMKKANLEDGKWVYQTSRSIILETSKTGWDSFIFSPSILKGNFAKGDVTYHYLLAYGGRKQSRDIANQVGIAYAVSLDGPWIKHGQPIITYDAEVSGDEYGSGAPSLVSYDEGGQVRLFYSYAETNLANERVVDCDFSDLNNIIIDKGIRHISVKGLRDNSDNVILSNADFALGEDSNLYVTRDVYPLSGNIPGNATSFQVAKANVGILNDFVNFSWEVVETVNTSMTVDFDRDNSMGWDEIYSPCFVRNPYGSLIVSDGKIEVIYSTAVEPEDEKDTSYIWSANLASHYIVL